MEKLYYQWWDEEVSEKYQVLKKYSYSLWYAAVAFILACFAIAPNGVQIAIMNTPYLIIHSVNCSLVWFFGRKSHLAKSLFSIGFSEFNCCVLWLQGTNEWKSNGILFEMLSLVFINSFELPFIQKSWMKSLVISKHLLLWNYNKYFRGELELSADYMPHIVAFLIIFLYNLNSYFLKSKSYERFISRKNLEDTKSRLSVIFSLITDGIIVLADNNEILYSNHNLTRLLNCHPNEVIEILSSMEYVEGKKYCNLSNSKKIIDDLNIIKRLGINEEVILGLCKVGNFILEWKGQKVIWERHETILLTVRDANIIVQFEQTTSDNKLKNVLLRSVSHELRTPINAITFLTEELMSDTAISSKKSNQEKLNMILVSSKLLISLVNDLLDYSKMLAGAFTVQKSKFVLNDVINNTIQLIQIQAEKKGIQIIKRIDPSLPNCVYTDPLRFSQIILNLLSNSLKFTLKGQIEVICSLDLHSRLKVMVKDTGIGISEENLYNLFKEFQSGMNQSINPHGCGLGLVISNRIAKELGGDAIDVYSEFGKGSIFSFSINIQDHHHVALLSYDDSCADESFSEFSTVSIRDFNSIKHSNENVPVLIADDNDFNRIILGTLLRQNNILFHEACTGGEVIDKVIKANELGRPYKLIIIDGSMPELNGWEATKIIVEMHFERKLWSLPTVIGYTAFTSESDVSLCLSSGMKECLLKPCSSELLMKTIMKYLPT